MNISNRIKEQFPEYIRQDHPKFVNFIENYYKFLESAELKLLMHPDSAGTFIVGETVQGSVSKAEAIINSIDTINSRIFVSTQNAFVPEDIISGSTSSAYGNFVSYTPNPVQTIDQLLAYRNIDSSIDLFFDEFRKEFMSTIPKRLTDSLDRNNLIKNINSLYKSKGTTDGHKLFFKILFNELTDVYYPAKDILKPSHGDWVYDTIIRVYGQIPDPSILNGQRLYQKNNPLSSIINYAYVDVEFAHSIYNDEGIELNINKETIKGEFISGEIAYIMGTDGITYYFELAELPTKIIISNPGQYYKQGEEVLLSGFQFPPIAKILNTSIGSLLSIDVINGGDNYVIGDKLILTNTGSQGYGTKAAVGEIESLGGEFTLEDSLSTIIQEDYTEYLSGVNGNQFIQEDGTADISSISLQYGGQNYDSIPILSISSVLGEAEEIILTSDNIGGILDIDIFEPGFRYTPMLDNINAYESLVIKDFSGTVDLTIIGKYVTSSSGGSGQIITFSPLTKVLKVRVDSGTFLLEDTLNINNNNGYCKIHLNESAKMNISTGVVFNYPGKYIGENGFVSSFAKRIQDSVYYQDFSYVVKIGRSINYWKKELKSTIHPVGFNLFGEVNVINLLYLGIKVPTADCTTFTPDLFSTLFIVFETKLQLPIQLTHRRYRISKWDKKEHIRTSPITGVKNQKRIEQFKFAQTEFLLNNVWDPNGNYDISLEDNTGSIEAENGDLIVQQVKRWIQSDTSRYGGHRGRGYPIKFINDYFTSISDVIDYPENYTPITPPSEITIKKII